MTVWGLHMGSHVGGRPIEDGYVAIGWQEMGDLRKLPADREAIKAQVVREIPSMKEGAVPVHAGTLFKFVHEIKPGDLVVYPSKNDRMAGQSRLAQSAARPVRMLQRKASSQPAL